MPSNRLGRHTQRARSAQNRPLTIVAQYLGPKDGVATFRGLFRTVMPKLGGGSFESTNSSVSGHPALFRSNY